MGKLAKILRKNIEIRMVELHLTQTKLSALAGIPQPHVNRLCTKPLNVSLETLEKLAKALQTKPSALITEDRDASLTKAEVIRYINKHLK